VDPAVLPWLSLVVAGTALAVSIGNLWLTQLRQGTVKMTRPSQIYLGPDGGVKGVQKVFLHTLLYSTANLGNHIEDLYVEVVYSQSSHIFPIWVHSEGTKLKRGSGLFVNRTGVSAAHHFLTSEDNYLFNLHAGDYTINVIAKLAGKKSTQMLHSTKVEISADEAAKLAGQQVGIYFDWGPKSQSYVKKIDDLKSGKGTQIILTQGGKDFPLDMN
jgi:hypothetical protein